MINITAKEVQTLRRMTDAPMMDCKVALVATKGNMDLAKEFLRKRGRQLADKKADRETNQGLVGVRVEKSNTAILGSATEVFCETDFVARNKDFQDFVLANIGVPASAIDTSDIISRVSENVKVGRSESTAVEIDESKAFTVVASYVHNQVTEGLGTIGVIVTLDSEPYPSNEEADSLVKLAHQVAMHIAAMKPKAIYIEDLDQDFVANEKRILTEQAQDTGKPANIIEKMVEGRLQKVLREVCLVDQTFVVDSDKTVGQALEKHKASVTDFIRLAIGE